MHIRMLLTIAQLSEVVKPQTIFLRLCPKHKGAIWGVEAAPADKAGAERDMEAVRAGEENTAEAPGRAETEAWAEGDADAAETTTRSMALFLALISPSFPQNMRKGKPVVQ